MARVQVRWRRVLCIVGLVAVVLPPVLVVGIDFLLVQVLIHPFCWNSSSALQQWGLTAESVTIRSWDGLDLAGWWVPPEPAPGPVGLLLSGWGGSRDGMLQEAAFLHRHGYGALAVEMRNCVGQPSTLGALEVEAGGGALDFLRLQPEADMERLGVLGFSVGGATAIMAADRFPELRAVVAMANYDNLRAHLLRPGEGNWLERLNRQLILFFFEKRTGVSTAEVSPIAAIPRLSPRPVFIIVGEKEGADAPALALYGAAGEPKELWDVPGAGHGQNAAVAPEEYEQRIVAFFDAALQP